MDALHFPEKMTTEWKRHLSLTTLMTQTAGDLAHCAWTASCASGTLPKSMPLAISDPYMPIPGLANEPPAPDPAQPSKIDDPYCGAYEELFNQLLS
eukprot:1027809-Pyramimonas_sp.AAC.1